MIHATNIAALESNPTLRKTILSIRLECAKRRWTFKRLALASGVSVGTLHRFFSGGNMSIVSFLRILDALDIDFITTKR